jgi:Holliday junction resolvasome RuvABC endonuclease subunit
MRVVAFDPGVRNLGVCVMSRDESPHLDVVQADDLDTFIESMRKFEPVISKCDIVAIESQPPMNRAVTKISNWIELFTRLHSSASIVFVSPAARVSRTRLIVDLQKNAPYRDRKAASVDAVTLLCGETVWENVKAKRDDAADAFLIALIASERSDPDQSKK